MRFMHMADVHLGAEPDYGYAWSKDRGREIWDTFRQCISDANEKNTDLLLIAGDLFHRQPKLQELKEVNYLFSTLENTVVILIAGNHDYIMPSSPYLNFPWSENVVCLFSQDCECIRLPELKTEIYGFSYYRQELDKPLYDNIRPKKNDYFKILLAHGGDAKHIPMNKESLAESGFDYIALGHIHKPQIFIPNLAAYSGAPEPIDCAEYGPHGYIIGDVRRREVKLAFVEKSGRHYLQEEVAVTEEDSSYSIRDKIAAAVREKGSQNIYRITLRGQRHPECIPDTEEYLKCGRILSVEDKTVPAFHIEKLKRQYHGLLIGDYIESFGDGPENAVEQKALEYGLEALLYPRK